MRLSSCRYKYRRSGRKVLAVASPLKRLEQIGQGRNEQLVLSEESRTRREREGIRK